MPSVWWAVGTKKKEFTFTVGTWRFADSLLFSTALLFIVFSQKAVNNVTWIFGNIPQKHPGDVLMQMIR